jgi:uncharacterized protein (DUF1015 family)
MSEGAGRKRKSKSVLRQTSRNLARMLYLMDQIFEKLKKKFFIRHLPFPMRYGLWCGVRVETCKTFAVSQHDLFFCNTQEDPQLLD